MPSGALARAVRRRSYITTFPRKEILTVRRFLSQHDYGQGHMSQASKLARPTALGVSDLRLHPLFCRIMAPPWGSAGKRVAPQTAPSQNPACVSICLMIDASECQLVEHLVWDVCLCAPPRWQYVSNFVSIWSVIVSPFGRNGLAENHAISKHENPKKMMVQKIGQA